MRAVVAVGIALGLSGCGLFGDAKDEVDTVVDDDETAPTSPSAREGDTTETPWVDPALCVEAVESAEPPSADAPIARPVMRDEFSKKDHFGNDRWGAGYELGFMLEVADTLEGQRRVAQAHATCSATVFRHQQDLGKVVVGGYSTDGEPSKFEADLVFLGKYVYPLFRFTGSFVEGDDFTHQLVELYIPYTILGVRVTFELEVWVTLGYHAAGQALVLGFAGEFSPHAGAVATGGVSLSDTVGVASASLLGGVELVDVRAPFAAGILVEPTGSGPDVAWSVSSDLDLRFLGGDLVAELALMREYRDVGAGFLGDKTLRETIADWDGFHSKWRLVSAEGRVNLGTGSKSCEGPSSAELSPPNEVPGWAGSGPDLRLASFDELLTILAQPSGDAARERGIALGVLKRRFRAQPELVTAALGHVDSAVAPLLLSALGAAGTPRALDALLEVAENAAHDERVRVAAIASLGLATRMTDRAALRLTELYHCSAGRIRETCAYAVGNAAASLATTNPRLAEELTDSLARSIRASLDAHEKIVDQRALENAARSSAVR